jgi:hypothetical protein
MKTTFLLPILLLGLYITSFVANATSCDIQLALYKAGDDYYLAKNTVGCDAGGVQKINRHSIIVQGENDVVVITPELVKDETFFKSVKSASNYHHKAFKKTLAALASEGGIERRAFFKPQSLSREGVSRNEAVINLLMHHEATRYIENPLENGFIKFENAYRDTLVLLEKIGLRNQAGTGFLDADYFSIEPISSTKARALINIYSEGEYTLTRQIIL